MHVVIRMSRSEIVGFAFFSGFHSAHQGNIGYIGIQEIEHFFLVHIELNFYKDLTRYASMKM